MAGELCSTDSLTSLLPPLLHDLLFLCSFLLHHPVAFACFLLLSPHLLSLLLFLYPLLFSTSLLLLALLTVSPHLHDSPSTFDEVPGGVFGAVLNILRADLVPDVSKASLAEQLCSMVLVVVGDHANQMVPTEVHFLSGIQPKQLVTAPQNWKFSEDEDDGRENPSENSGEGLRSESRPAKEPILPRQREPSRRPSEILKRDGSARKEKERTRTLACKLFEERAIRRLFEDRAAADGGADEMDLLWEAYEADARRHERRRRKPEHGRKAEEEDDGCDEEGLSGHPCCLKALRFSAGKVSLGVGRPSLVKMAMALKRIPLFHSARRGSSRGQQ